MEEAQKEFVKRDYRSCMSRRQQQLAIVCVSPENEEILICDPKTKLIHPTK